MSFYDQVREEVEGYLGWMAAFLCDVMARFIFMFFTLTCAGFVAMCIFTMVGLISDTIYQICEPYPSNSRFDCINEYGAWVIVYATCLIVLVAIIVLVPLVLVAACRVRNRVVVEKEEEVPYDKL